MYPSIIYAALEVACPSYTSTTRELWVNIFLPRHTHAGMTKVTSPLPDKRDAMHKAQIASGSHSRSSLDILGAENLSSVLKALEDLRFCLQS